MPYCDLKLTYPFAHVCIEILIKIIKYLICIYKILNIGKGNIRKANEGKKTNVIIVDVIVV